MYPLGITVIACTFSLVLQVDAQIPMPCKYNYTSNDDSRYCCPIVEVNGKSSACGSEAGRGECVNVSSLCNVGYTTVHQQDSKCKNLADKRLNWPKQFFTHVCRCNGNYGDYDCSSCAYGYTAVESGCTQTRSAPRRSITSLNDEEWEKYLYILNKSKQEISKRYVVLNGEENSHTPITTYDLFTWIHHYATKDHLDNYAKENTGCDYAHEATGFLSWHRIFLLWFERELQMLSGDQNFRVSYWDWTNFEGQDNWDFLFDKNRLGGSANGGIVTGDYFNSTNWKTCCLNISNQICNPNTKTEELLRCPVREACTNNGKWPTRNVIVEMAMKLDSFSDSMVFNKYSGNTFANVVEGYQSHTSTMPCEGLCNMDERSKKEFDRLLHNAVHILLGQGYFGSKDEGAMADVRASPNDPVFVNHHAMIDYIFEEWLKTHGYPSYQGPPTNSQFPGQAEGDCVVPFIPVFTHSAVFRPAEQLGYYYIGSGFKDDSANTDDPGTTDDSGSGSMLGSLLLVTTSTFLPFVVALLS